MSKQLQADMTELLKQVGFRRFLWRVIERGGIFVTATNGQDRRDLNFAEGRRSIALEILADVESGQAQQHPSGLPFAASIQVLVEEAQNPQQLMENPRGRRSRNDQYRELAVDGDSEPDGHDRDGSADG